MTPIPFVGPMYKSRSQQTNSQELINWYLQSEPQADGSVRWILLPTPGTNLLRDMPNAPAEIRQALVFDGDLWIVSGNRLYQMDSSLAVTQRGTLFTSSGLVSMACSETQIGIVDGVKGYVWDGGSATFTAISDPEFPDGAKRITYADGYAVVEAPGSDIWQISSVTDFRVWDGLDFSRVQSQPGNIISHIWDHGDLVMFKENSAEVFRNTGNADFPFERSGDRIEFGIVSPHAIAKLDNSFFFVGAQAGESAAVWRMSGLTPQRISTSSEEMMLGALDRVDDLLCFTQQEEGHSFLWVTSPTGNWTIVYDVATGKWGQRAHYKTTDGSLNRHRANCCVFFDRRHIVGDYDNGRMYWLDLNTFDDYTGPVKRVRTGPMLGDGRTRIKYARFGLLVEAGVGTAACPNPQMSLEYSDDGGRTWSNSVRASLGRMGEYSHMCEWYRTGAAKQRVFRVSTTDPVKAVIRGAYV